MCFSPCLVEITAILVISLWTSHALGHFLTRSIDSKKARAMAGGLQGENVFFLRQMNVCVFKYRGLYTNANTVHLLLALCHVTCGFRSSDFVHYHLQQDEGEISVYSMPKFTPLVNTPCVFIPFIIKEHGHWKLEHAPQLLETGIQSTCDTPS